MKGASLIKMESGSDLDVELLQVYQKMLTLQHTQCGMLLQEFNTRSSSSKKKREKKRKRSEKKRDMSQPLLIEADKEATTLEQQQRDESKEERELSLQIIEPPVDGGIFNKEEMNIVEGEEKIENKAKELENKDVDLSIVCVEEKIENKAEELENKAADLSIACVEEKIENKAEELENKTADLSISLEDKIENQQLVPPNSGVMDNDVPSSSVMDNVVSLPALLRDVKVEDDGTKKTSSKKKKKKKKKKKEEEEKMKEDRKETSCKVENRLFDLAILVMEEGDPNGKLACKGAKVKLHISAKVKGSEHPFESTKDGEPHIVKIDDERMIEGLRIGIEGMRVGEKRRVIIPPSLGYGDDGWEGMVPPNSWLEYEVHLIDTTMPR
ncbi:peptidyl-prolyl cis-trans isomerase FKBP43-like isoform X3 [Salvia miltiorrhiza]|uniref:peptidyl-prolyl cis-trans isomerase FKBP43-like isoform X3 n=1 Tax=Salvia miltiorrhiza TaxID=226208 RepID=UPI0025AC12D4|nr:peptidyl-prolyl cis-trans isomerase FKBP43-like isoform X3 [Salvia miltiorrhiza]